jgi:hypothetical protein
LTFSKKLDIIFKWDPTWPLITPQKDFQNKYLLTELWAYSRKSDNAGEIGQHSSFKIFLNMLSLL